MNGDAEQEYLEAHAPPALRSFGRRQGKSLSPRKQRLVAELLPRLRVLPGTGWATGSPTSIDPDALFPGLDNTWLEIGFGGAEHLLWQAAANPRTGIIGCEPFINGVAKALAGIEEQGLGNIRLHDGDARDVLAALPPACLARVFVLFPDPWPKLRHQKRRIASPETLGALARVMTLGAELRLATDIAPYARAMLTAIATQGSFTWTARKPSDWRLRPADWPETRYEQKALQAGRQCCYFRFVRKA